jgi:hypothetical protein
MDWLRSEDLKEEKVVTTSRMQRTTRGSDMLAPNVTTIVWILPVCLLAEVNSSLFLVSC